MVCWGYRLFIFVRRVCGLKEEKEYNHRFIGSRFLFQIQCWKKEKGAPDLGGSPSWAMGGCRLIQWKSMNIQWKSMKINENLWKSIKSMKINENPWKSRKSNENQWKAYNIWEKLGKLQRTKCLSQAASASPRPSPKPPCGPPPGGCHINQGGGRHIDLGFQGKVE